MLHPQTKNSKGEGHEGSIQMHKSGWRVSTWTSDLVSMSISQNKDSQTVNFRGQEIPMDECNLEIAVNKYYIRY